MEIKSVSELQRVISGYAAVIGNVDLGDDVIEPGAFTKTLAAKQPADIGVFVGHDTSSLPVGIPIVLRVDGKGLYSETLVKPGPVGDDLLATAQFMAAHGRPLGQSIGYRVYPGGAKFDRRDGKAVRRLLSIDVHEYSFAAGMAVMNPEAITTGVKTGGAMRYTVEKQGDKWAVMRDGKAIGSPFDDEDTAKAKAATLNADDSDGGKTVLPNTLPDSAFLYVAPGGQVDDENKTVPRSLRHFRYRDEAGALDAEALTAALAEIPQAKTLGFSDSAFLRLEARVRTLLESAGAERKTVDADATEWTEGTPIVLRGLAYRLLDLSEKIAGDHQAMRHLGDDTKTGQRMRPEARALVRELAQQLSSLVDTAEYVDQARDGAADVAQRRRRLQLTGLGV